MRPPYDVAAFSESTHVRWRSLEVGHVRASSAPPSADVPLERCSHAASQMDENRFIVCGGGSVRAPAEGGGAGPDFFIYTGARVFT